MEHLTKQQIVLLTLFVSFVTSIATGIVAVSLMDQSPAGVTQTINRVVERTIERVVSNPSASTTSSTASVASAVISIQDVTAESVEKVSKSVVRLKPRNGLSSNQLGGADSVTGLGLVISKEGVIITDKAVVTSTDFVAVFPDGKEFPIQTLQSQILGDIVFMAVIAPRDYVFHPASARPDAKPLRLGETVFALGGKVSDTLDQGLVTKVPAKAGENIETSISSRNIVLCSPLFTTAGDVVGIKTTSILGENSFYPLDVLKPITPIISR